MTLDEFLDKLEGVVPSGTGYKAVCPHHEDNEPSLGVTEGDEGILVNCYAGCDTADVLTDMGLKFSDLFFKSASINYAEPEAVYPYPDENGEEIFQVLRFPGKKFRQRHYDPDDPDAKEDGWVWKMEGVRRVPYRLPAILAAVAAGETIYIAEGEKDVAALVDRGAVATCCPGGAGKWKPEFNAHFEGANVVVVADRDEPGRNHAATVRAGLTGIARGVWVVQAKRGKDAYDHLVTHSLPLRDLVPLRERKRRGVVSATEMAEAARERLDFRETDLPSFTPCPEIWDELVFRLGRLYTLGGYTGDGKTSVALQITTGLCRSAVPVGYFSLEMTEEDLMNRLIVQNTGLDLWRVEHPWTLTPEQRAVYIGATEEISNWPLDIIFDTAISAQRVTEITRDGEYQFVVFDHIHRQSKDRQKLEETVVALTNLALEQNVAVLVLAQLRKFQRGNDMIVYPRPSLQDFRETSVLGDDSSMSMAIWRTRIDGTRYDPSGTSELIVLKNRHGATHSKFLHFDGPHMRFEGDVNNAYDPTGHEEAVEEALAQGQASWLPAG